MFDINNFIINTILIMVGKEPEYKVRQYALGWFDKGILKEEDLAVIQAHITEVNNLVEE